MNTNLLRIAVVEEGSPQVRGGFCSTRDVVTAEESATLTRLKELHKRAAELKAAMQATPLEQQDGLFAELANVRREAAIWRQRRELATQEKHRRLGHTQLTLDG